jgi:hypothetical protein
MIELTKLCRVSTSDSDSTKVQSMLCNLCKTLPKHVTSEKRHERLQQTGITERIRNPGKIKAAWITYYTCEICETKWRHIDDPAQTHNGWSVEQPHPVPERADNQSPKLIAARRS